MGPRASQDLRSPSPIMAPGFGNIHSFCYMTIFLDGCSSFGHFGRNLQKNKRGDPIFLLQIFNLLYMAVNWAKFEKHLDSISF